MLSTGMVMLKDAAPTAEKESRLFENIFETYQFDRKTPGTIGKPLHWKFLPGAHGLTEQTQPVAARVLKNAKVLGPSGTIINAENKLVYDASLEICLAPETHSVFNRVIYKKPREIKGLGLNLSASQGQQNYFHWMTDALPKLAIAEAIGYDKTAFDYFIVNSRQEAYQKQTLRSLEIPTEKIMALDEHPYLVCQSVLVTTATCASGNVAPWIIDFLRNNFLPGGSGTSAATKIFIGRKNAIRRKLLNEKELSEKLKELSFETVYLEEKTVEEQAALFANADIIVAAHGAGLTNVTFCKPRTKLIELFSPTYINQGFWTMASVNQLDYHYLIGEGIEVENNFDLLRNTDFSVSISEVINFLEKE